MKPCRTTFYYLARHEPYELAKWCESGELDTADLSFAAEILGGGDHVEVEAVLLRLLDHSQPLVREGAVHGLAAWLQEHDFAKVLEQLGHVAKHDESPGVRAAASDALAATAEPKVMP